MDKYFTLPKAAFPEFIQKLTSKRKVVAPVQRAKNNFSFEEVTDASQISLRYIPTILPPKKYFMPQRESVLAYNKKEKTWTPIVESEEIAIFGVHTCDLAGIAFLNFIMSNDPKDTHYLARKEKIILIGLECKEYCDEYASCRVMNNHNPDGNYDLFFTDLESLFLVHVATEKGEKVISETGVFKAAGDAQLKELEAIRQQKETTFKPEVNVKHEQLKELFAKAFESKVWEDVGNRCLACGNCTAVCPTCYCFDLRDEINWDFTTGVKYRVWDSCQNEEFAKVAGGENFRKTRAERQRHRYMRKFNYPVTRQGMYACTGCGRCSRTCMADINLKETINQLAEELL